MALEFESPKWFFGKELIYGQLILKFILITFAIPIVLSKDLHELNVHGRRTTGSDLRFDRDSKSQGQGAPTVSQ